MKSQHINSTRRSQNTTTQKPRHCKILPATLHAYFRSSHTYISIHAGPGPPRNSPTPYHKSRHSFRMDCPLNTTGYKRAEIQPLVDFLHISLEASEGGTSQAFVPTFFSGLKHKENLKTTSDPWLQDSSFFLRISHAASTGYRRQQGSSPLFWPQDLMFISFVS